MTTPSNDDELKLMVKAIAYRLGVSERWAKEHYVLPALQRIADGHNKPT